jgi:hypothetical protein
MSASDLALTKRWIVPNLPSATQDGLIPVAYNGNLTYVDPRMLFLGPQPGADLDDSAPTLDLADGAFRVLPDGTLTANRVATIDDNGATAGAVLYIARIDVEAFTYQVDNGGPGGGTLYTFPVSVSRGAKFKFDGTNWALDEHWAITGLGF